MNKFLHTLFAFIALSALHSLQADDIEFEYDDAGNCVLKYKTVVLPARSNAKENADSTAKPQIESISGRDVLIYPNPTKGALKIEIKGEEPENPIQYLLADMNGRTISAGESTALFYHFDMSPFASGVYLLQVKIDGRWKKWKIIKE